MKDFLVVASFTIKEMIKKKSFIISNIIILIIIIVGFNVPNIINMFKGDTERKDKIVILDINNTFEGTLESLKQAETGYNIEIINNEISKQDLKEKIKNNEINQALVISKAEDKINLEYIVKSIGMTTVMPEQFMSSFEKIYTNLQISKLNLTQEQIQLINTPFEFKIEQAEDKQAAGNILIMMLLSMVLFYAIYFYAYQVSSSITIEKTSKIIETLVTSTTPRIIIIGKTIGIGIVGIFQTIITIIVCVLCARFILPIDILNSVLDISNITPMVRSINYIILCTWLFYICTFICFNRINC